MTDAPFVESILLPSDFSEASHAAFDHALALALYLQASFEILHVVTDDRALDDWSHAPAVRQTLERWGLLEPGSPRSAVKERLSIEVGKLNVRSRDPVKAIVADIERAPVDLVVLATEGRDGAPRWLRPSIAEGVARKSRSMTLFVPKGIAGFVSADDGRIAIKRILLPVDRKPSPTAAVNYAARAAVMSREDSVEIELLHVGSGEAPWPVLPDLQSCAWRKRQREGDPVEQIRRAADELSADLIVMPTEGRKGILGTLRGSVTERVLRGAPCPLLAVRAGEG